MITGLKITGDHHDIPETPQPTQTRTSSNLQHTQQHVRSPQSTPLLIYPGNLHGGSAMAPRLGVVSCTHKAAPIFALGVVLRGLELHLSQFVSGPGDFTPSLGQT